MTKLLDVQVTHKKEYQLFRIVIFIAISLLILISVGGYIASYMGWLTDDLKALYTTHFSFVTGLASVIGLLAFASTKKIRSTDFETEELEKLQNLMKTAQALQAIETNKSHTEQQLIDLERKKKLMEISVKKAGLVLFYKSQIERYDPVIGQKIDGDGELKLAVKESIEARERLKSLSEEIESDENVELIKSILEKPDRHPKNTDPVLIWYEAISESLGKFFPL
jgi:hypothetical protein